MQGRPRKRGRGKLPSYVSVDRKNYVYRPYLGRRNGKTIWGEFVTLGPTTMNMDEVWQAYTAAKTDTLVNTLAHLSKRYMNSATFLELATGTQKNYRRELNFLCEISLRGGGKFGGTIADDITSGTLQKLYEKRRQTAPTGATRELAALSAAFSWGVSVDAVKRNPVRGVKRKKIKSRERYITDREYQAVYQQAAPKLKIAMEFAYLCRMRRTEVCHLDRTKHFDELGVLVERAKGSKTQRLLWTPRLEKAYKDAKALNKGVVTKWVLHNADGTQWREGALSSAWQKAYKLAFPSGLDDGFTFHDLKAKGVTDFEGDKQAATGDHSPQMRRVYDRSIEQIDATK